MELTGSHKGLFARHEMIFISFIYMYEMSDFICVTQIISLIVLKGKTHAFHPSEKRGGKVGIGRTSITIRSNGHPKIRSNFKTD
jgi:hypothetical protein